MVRKSSTVIRFLRGSGLATGRRSLKKGRTGDSARRSPRSTVAPTSIPVTVLVAERVLRNASAPTVSKYRS